MALDTAAAASVSLGELVSVAVFIIGAIWTIGKIGMNQYAVRMEEKFKAVNDKLLTFDPLHTRMARVDTDLVQVRLEMATSYVRQDGIRVLTTRMEQLFKEVFDKLESKADKDDMPRRREQ